VIEDVGHKSSTKRRSDMNWNDALERIRARTATTARSLCEGFPHFADPDTKQWTCSIDGDWTGGYFCALLWLGAATGPSAERDQWLRWAREWSQRLRPRLKSDSSSRALLFYYGAALGSILCADREARDLALEAAQALATMYNPRAGLLPLGTAFEEVSNVGRAEAEVDMVQAAALMTWASHESGDPGLLEIAVSHARRHIDLCMRADGSICQSASFDTRTGAMVRRYTHKGISDNSTWARAQAWGMLGWALSTQWCGDSAFLEPAEKAASWWIEHVPPDRVTFWDFDDPDIPNTNRDTSATAIAAASLLKLSALSRNESKRRAWRDAAEATVCALIERHLGQEGGLWDGCFNKRIGLATRHELIWGTYYLFEALQVLAGKLEPSRI
jgi:unsaturated chondroitin disaccharide hydrolase